MAKDHSQTLIAEVLAAFQEFIELSSEIERAGEARSDDLRGQADRYLLTRATRDIAKDFASKASALFEREQARLYRLMSAQGVPRFDVDAAEGAFTLYQTTRIYPRLNPDVVDIDDDEARATAIAKLFDFVEQVGDGEELIDREPRLRFARMGGREFARDWIRRELDGEVSIPPELDLLPREIVGMRRKPTESAG